MNDSLNRAIHYLTGSENIDELTAEDLEKIVNDHPYFPVAHFLLSKKLKKENSPHFLSQVQRTALYFPNPYWLHYQLLNDLPSEPIIYETDEPAIGTADDVIHQTSEHDEEVPAIEESTDGEVDHSEYVDDEHLQTTELSYEHIQREQPVNGVDKPDNSSEREGGMPDNVVNEADAESTLSREVIEEPTPNFVEAGPTILNGYHAPATQAEEEAAAITRDTDETTEHFLDEVAEKPEVESDSTEPIDVPAEQEQAMPEDDEHEKMFQNIKAMLDASAEEANAGVKSTIVPIDPYYTIDYFAAQGIKLDLEKNPQDKLGKQVKKFTQWLKHMKKLGPEDALASETPTLAEVEAQQTADASNIAREVVTEAMALVLEKQGKKDKAIQLYRKLTFLNPHKSAYFADKINHLNGL